MFGLELSAIWAVLIAVAVFLYVALDGFDLGVGILFPFAKDARERDQMQASIAPVWDGNETWLVLGGGGLFAAFPKAYAALMPALYAPIILMLLALIFRGVAFEFRHHARGQGKRWWTIAFAGGSITATIARLGAGRLYSGREHRERRVRRRIARLADAVLAAGGGGFGGGLCAAGCGVAGV
ncbi:MAG TPA: cytochrome d ubiquinol oxidase subunit II [Terricaulis sp.]|nr:cytochrome d ubiquinol oxidase subunit II [Terricaulis sp.]